MGGGLSTRSGVRRGWSAVEPLNQPTRRRVYAVLRAQDGPLTRDEVAAALGIGRSVAAFHLEALARSGLLEVDFARPNGRRGPGAGRPAKRYRAAVGDIALSVPERRYELAAQILAAGVRDSAARDAQAATFVAAHDKGVELGRAHARPGEDGAPRERVRAVLEDLGYEPVGAGEALRLENCPFHAILEVGPDLVCRMNLHLIEGLLDGLGLADHLCARFAPTPGACCVRIGTAPEAHTGGAQEAQAG
jgi:predicted ArsR family transcriptional regulator